MSKSIVIPLGKSKTDFLDLKYCLRSIEKFADEVGRVFLIGECPKWAVNLSHYSFDDNQDRRYKERNIWAKLKFACGLDEVTEKFIMFNDDHILLEPTDLSTYPNYYKGTCYQSMERNSSSYRATMNHTKKWLEANGHEDINADGHCPILFNKKEFQETFTEEMWDIEYGYGMKSIYCAKNNKPMTFMQDCKLHTRMTKDEVAERVKGRSVFSFTDASLKTGVKDYLQELFPHPSIYERT